MLLKHTKKILIIDLCVAVSACNSWPAITPSTPGEQKRPMITGAILSSLADQLLSKTNHLNSLVENVSDVDWKIHDNGQCAVHTRHPYTKTTVSSHSLTTTITYHPTNHWLKNTGKTLPKDLEKNSNHTKSASSCAENTAINLDALTTTP